MENKLIDVFCHYLPPGYLEAALRSENIPHILKRVQLIPSMVNYDARLAVMDQFPGYQQVPSLPSPPIELLAGPDESPQLARIGNDELAAFVARDREHFPGFVATLPMNNPEAAVEEAKYSIEKLGACGIQVYTNVNGRPLDEECFMPLFALMADYDLPIWLHPTRDMDHEDYRTETISKYEIWWSLGWPYETSVAMTRLVFAGIFDRWPNLKIITHHAGAMIPFFEGRLGSESFGRLTPENQKEAIRTSLSEPPLQAFRRFYADTATSGSKSAIECSIAFFGADHMLFATDAPFGPGQGAGFVEKMLHAINEMELSSEEREKILCGNARRLLKLN